MLLPNTAAVQHSHLKHRRIVSGPQQLARCRLGGSLRLAVPLRVVPAGVLADRDLVNRDNSYRAVLKLCLASRPHLCYRDRKVAQTDLNSGSPAAWLGAMLRRRRVVFTDLRSC